MKLWEKVFDSSTTARTEKVDFLALSLSRWVGVRERERREKSYHQGARARRDGVGPQRSLTPSRDQGMRVVLTKPHRSTGCFLPECNFAIHCPEGVGQQKAAQTSRALEGCCSPTTQQLRGVIHVSFPYVC